jgi:DNA-directed RNA polymerase specialized sigma subunit
MKIPLNMNRGSDQVIRPDAGKISERDVANAVQGDWQAKGRLIQAFIPVMTAMARKKTTDTAGINDYVEAGENGLLRAAQRYKPTGNPGKFQIFAVDFIEKAMDDLEKPRGFLARLFSR